MDNETSFDHDLPEDCQPKPFVGGEYELVECSTNQWICRFSLRFGNRLLCRHLHRKDLIENQKISKKQAGTAETRDESCQNLM